VAEQHTLDADIGASTTDSWADASAPVVGDAAVPWRNVEPVTDAAGAEARIPRLGAIRRARILTGLVALAADTAGSLGGFYLLSTAAVGVPYVSIAGVPPFLTATAAFVAIAAVGHAYDPRWIATGHGTLRGLFIAALAGGTLACLLTGAGIASAALIVFALSLMAVLVREACARVVGPHVLAERVVVVGIGEVSASVAGTLAGVGGPTYSVLGFLDDRTDPRRYPRGVGRLLGRIEDAPGVALKQQADLVVVGIPGALRPGITEALTACAEVGVGVVRVGEFYAGCFQRIPVEHMKESWVTYSLRPSPSLAERAAKRGMDIALALVALLATALVAPAIWLANRFFSPGPLFYWQTRLGENGQEFRIVKFRTMVRDAEARGALWASGNDARVTAVGRFLRKTHLDELPQAWNVFRGEMSMVGPRPERPEFVARLEREIPHYGLRHLVKPGLTGLATVRNGYASSLKESLWKTEYDLYYIKHGSIWLDVWLLLETVLVCAVGRRPQRTS